MPWIPKSCRRSFVIAILSIQCADAAGQEAKLPFSPPRTANEHVELRRQLDASLWKDEVAAQRHEQPFIRLWDDLRAQSNKLDVLKSFAFTTLQFQSPRLTQGLELDIQAYALDGGTVSLSPAEWTKWLEDVQSSGYRLVQTEWHHSAFKPASDGNPPHSVVSFVIDVARDEPARRASFRGELHVRWSDASSADGLPLADTIEARNVTILVRDRAPAFEEVLSTSTDGTHKRLMPLVVYDLNKDGRSEIILGGVNKIYWNHGQGQFFPEPISPGLDIFDTGLVADFTGDGQADFICIGVDRRPSICAGKPDGRFQPPTRCADVRFEFPKSMTAGDIDGDGDLDLWIGQYKFLYFEGSMPTPFYDANDGYPASLLVNDGTGRFADVTESAGLGAKRNRRTYSSSLVDLDDDGDLDLMTVNDFAGADLYRNDGDLRFTDATDQWVDHRHLFGMGHTLADFNLDEKLDMYVIGMSSTTARRLDRLNLGREDHPDINRMRQAMGYGNRMLLRRDENAEVGYRQAAFNDHVARTGWSWGTTAIDFDNDGDKDIYVANGHNSGRSAADYCTRYWCHDVYTGASSASEELLALFNSSLSELREGEISWNGFEHNVLMMNLAGKDFARVEFLMGVASESDSRGVVSEDLDGDGRLELLYVQFEDETPDNAKYTLHVLHNRLETGHRWVGVRLTESADGPSPIGAEIAVKTDGGRQIHRIVTGDSFSSQHSTIAHFGLGDAQTIDAIEVRWPDGARSVVQGPQPDRYYDVTWRE
jgi:hypothetical protein